MNDEPATEGAADNTWNTASPGDSPTNVRFAVIGATTLTAAMLYLDRICIAEIAKLDEFNSGLNLSEQQTGWVMSAFFFSYALGQVPAGWLSDRFGARRMLPLYICVWSLSTILTGMATGFPLLIAARLLFGISQAGCYPTAGSLVKRWIALPNRGTASAVISFGGRVGGAIAPLLTAWLLSDYLSWRWVLTVYGGIGFFVAAFFWKVFRNSPAEHPECNDAERTLITQYDVADGSETSDMMETPPTSSTIQLQGRFAFLLIPILPVLPLLRNVAMWLMCLLQFGINIGWVFLVTWLPTYLKEVKKVDPKIGGMMSTIVLCAGIVGMLGGGPLTDASVVRFGKRWGRSLPMVGCFTIAVAAYLSCLFLDSAWAFIAAASVVAFATDLSVPGIWAYMQDVGGKNTAAVFGWGNMWGNFGAGVTPILVPFVLEHWDTNGDWSEAFLLFSAGYVVAGLCALGINANSKIT